MTETSDGKQSPARHPLYEIVDFWRKMIKYKRMKPN